MVIWPNRVDLSCLSLIANAAVRSALNTSEIFFSNSDKSFFSTTHCFFPQSLTNASIAAITGTNFSCPNLTASNIIFSDKPEVSDSTIKTASLVPATTRFKFDCSISSLVGLDINLPSIYPTLEAPTGPWKGIPEIAKAAEQAIIANTSGSLIPS